MNQIAEKTLTKSEAETLCRQIKEQANNLRELLQRMRDERGWEALGYDTWADCCEKEFRISKQHANRLIKAEHINRQVEPIGSTSMPESHARELAGVPEDRQEAVLERARELACGKRLIAANIREAVQEETGVLSDDVYEEEDSDADDCLEADSEEEEEIQEEQDDGNPIVATHKDWLTEATEELAFACGNKLMVAEYVDGLAGLISRTDQPVISARLENLAVRLRQGI